MYIQDNTHVIKVNTRETGQDMINRYMRLLLAQNRILFDSKLFNMIKKSTLYDNHINYSTINTQTR